MTSCAWRLVPTKRIVLPSAASLVTNSFGLAKQLHRLAEVDDVDAVPFAEDVFLHLRIPALRLVAEVNPRLQQILHRDRGQMSSLSLSSIADLRHFSRIDPIALDICIRSLQSV